MSSQPLRLNLSAPPAARPHTASAATTTRAVAKGARGTGGASSSVDACSGSGESGCKRADYATPLCGSTCGLLTRPRLASPSEPAQPEEGEGGE